MTPYFFIICVGEFYFIFIFFKEYFYLYLRVQMFVHTTLQEYSFKICQILSFQKIIQV